MSFAAQIYVDKNGTVYGASETDQRYTSHTLASDSTARTVRGRIVAYAGKWYGSQMDYRPYLDAVRSASERAAELESCRG